MANNVYIIILTLWNFSSSCFLYICIKHLRKALELWKIPELESLKETGPSYEKSFVSLGNIGCEQKTLISDFV